MGLQPWYKVVTPREDLRDNRPLDASEFAVHLDQVRDGRAPDVYQKPVDFFERTYLTENLSGLAAEVIRRLSGTQVETSPVFNLTTQFGGGKTHALTLLYHLAHGGAAASSWKGVSRLLTEAKVERVPEAAVAVFVGTEFDSLTGRGGTDGTPVRKTPWGEMAWQLADGDIERFRIVEEHERTLTAPGGDVLAKLLPPNRPSLLLFDELMNYVSRYRKSGLAGQLYSFIHSLSEVVRSRADTVLAVSIPASEIEMTAEDQADYERFKKLVDRVGKAVFMSSEGETSEIIRRRLFEWHGLPAEASKTVGDFADWVLEHRHQLPSWFPVDTAHGAFAATYPFHPSVISVFERKWQGLPRFQQTRGVLRLLALWVSHAYNDGFKGAHKDPLITLGTAPLESSMFRAAVFDQLGESRLEAAITTDIVGKDHAHALRLDKEGTPEVRNARLHRKVATTIFFESNGGQQRGEATLPEIRLAVAEPDLDIGNIEQCLEALVDTCYYLGSQKNRYRFSFQPNLNKLLADRRASVPGAAIRERVRAEVIKVFEAGRRATLIPFPEKSGDIPDRPALTLVVLDPEASAQEAATSAQMLGLTREYGAASRTYKSALIWCVAEEAAKLHDEARKLLAWQDIESDSASLRIDEDQLRQLQENLGRAQRDLREAVWRSYRNVFLLDSDNALRRMDLGLVNSSGSPDGTLAGLILSRLQQADIVVESVSPAFLARNWSPALPEWSTRSVRDAFYASPKLPRLLSADAIQETIARGVGEGFFAYVAKRPDGSYDPFRFRTLLSGGDVEISDDVFLIQKETAEEYLGKQSTGGEGEEVRPLPVPPIPEPPQVPTPSRPPTAETVPGFRWQGTVDARKWMNFYTKVLTPFATSGGVNLTLEVVVHPAGGVSVSRIDEMKVVLRELGLGEEIEIEEEPGGPSPA
ncbi:MAG: hypothetical protein QOF89_5960 [Acidobacteriota bacterium]|jgi:hypothetical protein|nr:hypothetical protein [Acidobacteriota bacterium]